MEGDGALEGGGAAVVGFRARTVGGGAEGYEDRDKGRGEASRGVLEGPHLEVLVGDVDGAGDAKGGGGADDGAEAGGAVEDNAALDVGVGGATEEVCREEVGEGVGGAAEDAELVGGKVVGDVENQFGRNGRERHDGDVVVFLLIVLLVCCARCHGQRG